MTVKYDGCVQCSALQRASKAFYLIKAELLVFVLFCVIFECGTVLEYFLVVVLYKNPLFLKEFLNIHGTIFQSSFWALNCVSQLGRVDKTARNMVRLTNARWSALRWSLKADEVFQKLDDATIQAIFKESEAHRTILSGVDVVSTTFNPPMHSHPRTDIACNNDLSTLTRRAVEANTAFQSRALAKGNYDKIIALWTAANSLKLLHRFTHRDQPFLLRRPLPDGENLLDWRVSKESTEDPGLHKVHAEWQFYRFWIRFLHLCTLSISLLELLNLTPVNHVSPLFILSGKKKMRSGHELI